MADGNHKNLVVVLLEDDQLRESLQEAPARLGQIFRKRSRPLRNAPNRFVDFRQKSIAELALRPRYQRYASVTSSPSEPMENRRLTHCLPLVSAVCEPQSRQRPTLPRSYSLIRLSLSVSHDAVYPGSEDMTADSNSVSAAQGAHQGRATACPWQLGDTLLDSLFPTASSRWLAMPWSHETFIHRTSPALPAHRVPSGVSARGCISFFPSPNPGRR